MSDITVELIGGVQVSVETGTAFVAGIAAKNRNIEITLDDPTRRADLKFPLRGWLDKADTEALALAERVQGGAEMVRYRIEVHRDSKVDPSIPIADVPREPHLRRRRLVSLVPAAEVSGNVSGNAEPAPWDGLPETGDQHRRLAQPGLLRGAGRGGHHRAGP